VLQNSAAPLEFTTIKPEPVASNVDVSVGSFMQRISAGVEQITNNVKQNTDNIIIPPKNACTFNVYHNLVRFPVVAANGESGNLTFSLESNGQNLNGKLDSAEFNGANVNTDRVNIPDVLVVAHESGKYIPILINNAAAAPEVSASADVGSPSTISKNFIIK
jgi:hypothetical protein